jgi:hypothetical protein
MHKLNFPEAVFQITEEYGKLWIFDRIRKKKIVLTPEEWVRQHLLSFLIEHRNCPRSLIQVEHGVTCNNLPRRVDVLVFDRQGLHWMVAECKAAEVPLTPQTAHQLAQYNMPLQARYLLLTNGLVHYCFAADYRQQVLTPLQDIPYFE